MKLLLDSHTLLWALYESHKLPQRVNEILRDNSQETLISAVSPWELMDKATKFRLPMAGSSPDGISRDVEALRMKMVPITMEDILASVKLPRYHNDPMDRVLIAQAQRLNATLLSKDGKFKFYDVPVFWG